jgi:ribonuclease D
MADPRTSISVTTSSRLDDLAQHLRDSGRFAFDTEFVSEDSFDPELGLIQVATLQQLALVDPLSVRPLNSFWDVLLDSGVEVVMHAAKEDLRICRAATGRLPQRLVDVQIAAGLLGLGYPSALGVLTQRCLGVSLAGSETRTDWMRRPLSPAQVRYALDDVRHLLELADFLQGELARLGRLEWAEAEYQRLLGEVDSLDDGNRWRRLPGLHQLNRRGLEAARGLWEWRREEARRANRPLRQVMRDDLLVGIAKRLPSTRHDLEALRDYQRPHLLRLTPQVLKVISDARSAPEADLPPPIERPDEGPNLSMVVNLLVAVLNRSCAEHRLAPGLVGSASDLRELVRWHLAGQTGDDLPDLLRGWRREVCGEGLLDVLSGRRSIRITAPGCDDPLTIDPVDDHRAPPPQEAV